MMTFVRSLLLLLCGILVGSLIVWKRPVLGQAAAPGQADANGAKGVDINALDMEVTRLKSIAPTQSHVMVEVAFLASNLWFAAEQKNWALANYYFGEMRGRIRWMIRINPMSKQPSGVVDLQPIFDGIDTGIMSKVKQAIDSKDSAQFTAAYKGMLQGCYSCHTAAGRQYLRPVIPTTPPQSIISYDPNGSAPQ